MMDKVNEMRNDLSIISEIDLKLINLLLYPLSYHLKVPIKEEER